MKKVLVVGANGQLGSSIKEIHSEFQFEFIFTDLQELDVTSKKSVDDYFEIHQPDFVVNCAAYTAVDKAESEPEKAELLNIVAVYNLSIASARYKAVFVHISTDYVFDGTSSAPLNELAVTSPMSVYGQTKLLGENSVKAYKRGVIIRTSWLYSSYGANFVKTMQRIGAEKERVSVVSDQIGSPTCAIDLSRAILKIVTVISNEPYSSDHYGTFHYSNEGECSWCDFARAIMEFSGLKCEVDAISSDQYPTAAKRPKYSLLSKEKVKKRFNIIVPNWLDSLKNNISSK